MKPLITFLLLVPGICGAAQTGPFEIKAGVGGYSRAFFNDGGKAFDVISLGEKRYNTGPFSVEGLCQFSRFKAGVSVVYEVNKLEESDIDFFGGGGNGDYYPATKNSTTTILLSGYYSFVKKNRSSFYAGLALGPSFNSKTDYQAGAKENTVLFGYQVTAIGYECHKKLGFFIECGYGYKGIISTGLTFTFGQP